METDTLLEHPMILPLIAMVVMGKIAVPLWVRNMSARKSKNNFVEWMRSNNRLGSVSLCDSDCGLLDSDIYTLTLAVLAFATMVKVSMVFWEYILAKKAAVEVPPSVEWCYGFNITHVHVTILLVYRFNAKGERCRELMLNVR